MFSIIFKLKYYLLNNVYIASNTVKFPHFLICQSYNIYIIAIFCKFLLFVLYVPRVMLVVVLHFIVCQTIALTIMCIVIHYCLKNNKQIWWYYVCFIFAILLSHFFNTFIFIHALNIHLAVWRSRDIKGKTWFSITKKI